MNLRRLCRHWAMTKGRVQKFFPLTALQAIETTIQASERAHVGEIRFVVEGALDGVPLWCGQTPRERAIEVFAQLRVWDTEYNNGVLIYLLLADRDVEIVADRGISAKVPQVEWDEICRTMEAAFQVSNYEAGVVSGIQAVSRHLISIFPAHDAGRNELSDRPLLL